MATWNIAIVGSGIAGLSSAAFLKQAGHEVHVFESFEKPAPVGAGLLIQPTGLSVLTKHGLSEKVIQGGQRINRLLGKRAGPLTLR
ncbi:MAG: 2-polyprenyl-6-methoxyphenol hydroxylase-like FAD-dependent oxidoreductase [Parvicella sp.]